MELRIPASGDAVGEVEIIEWSVLDGASVTEQQVICLLGTDKATVEFEAPQSGVLRIIESAGGTFAIGHLIGHID